MILCTNLCYFPENANIIINLGSNIIINLGSNSWYNYRHQADVCHAYQIVSQHGVPDEQIIVLM